VHFYARQDVTYKVSFEDCVATFLELMDLEESILLLPVFVLWLGAQAVGALFHHHILSSDYVAEALAHGFLIFLLILLRSRSSHLQEMIGTKIVRPPKATAENSPNTVHLGKSNLLGLRRSRHSPFARTVDA